MSLNQTNPCKEIEFPYHAFDNQVNRLSRAADVIIHRHELMGDYCRSTEQISDEAVDMISKIVNTIKEKDDSFIRLVVPADKNSVVKSFRISSTLNNDPWLKNREINILDKRSKKNFDVRSTDDKKNFLLHAVFPSDGRYAPLLSIFKKEKHELTETLCGGYYAMHNTTPKIMIISFYEIPSVMSYNELKSRCQIASPYNAALWDMDIHETLEKLKNCDHDLNLYIYEKFGELIDTQSLFASMRIVWNIRMIYNNWDKLKNVVL